MTSHVPAGGCHFELRHFTVHIFFLKHGWLQWGWSMLTPAVLVPCFMVPSEWHRITNTYLATVTSSQSRQQRRDQNILGFFLFLRMNRLYRSEDVLPLLLLIYTELVFCSNNDRSSQYTHDHWLTATDALKKPDICISPTLNRAHRFCTK